MIKYNNNTIYDWNFDTSNVIKVYRNNAIVFYKFSGESPTPEWKVCFAVVDDITQYQETEFEDVFDNATEKWYKLNNLNQYEEYGVYGSGRGITYYKGKLTIDDGYEYEWNGSSWINLGEVSGSSRLPQGYTEVEYIENTSTAHINTMFKPNQDTRIVTEMQTVKSTNYGRFLGAGAYNKTNAIQFDYETGAQGTLHISWGNVAGWTIYSSCVGDYNKHTYDWNKNEFYRDNALIGSATYSNFQCTDYLAIFANILNGTSENFLCGRMYTFQLYDNGTLVRDLVPSKRDSDDKYGAYDIVNDVFYTSPDGVDFIGGSETGSTEYPKYYTEKSEPLDNLTFNTLAEAQTYAYNNCVFDGMKATIDGDRYYFDSSDENGWVYNPSKLPQGYTEVEYIENKSRAYINTGFKPNQNTKILITTQCVTSTSGGRQIGAGGYDKTNAIQFDYESGAQGTLHISWGNVAGWTIYSSCVGDYDKHTYEWDGNMFYRDKGKQNQFSATTAYSTYQCTDNLGIFTRHQNGSGGGNSECFKGKVFDFKMYDNGTLVRDLVPCISPNDVVGMYDVVNNTFYSSANSYNFVAGNPI